MAKKFTKKDLENPPLEYLKPQYRIRHLTEMIEKGKYEETIETINKQLEKTPKEAYSR